MDTAEGADAHVMDLLFGQPIQLVTKGWNRQLPSDRTNATWQAVTITGQFELDARQSAPSEHLLSVALQGAPLVVSLALGHGVLQG
ncbi:hypothetical protein CR157_16970 [Halomonas sp. LBP4]|nr:hypothetical protein CR157_16970 [Halomonas sp. LBP4]